MPCTRTIAGLPAYSGTAVVTFCIAIELPGHGNLPPWISIIANEHVLFTCSDEGLPGRFLTSKRGRVVLIPGRM